MININCHFFVSMHESRKKSLNTHAHRTVFSVILPDSPQALCDLWPLWVQEALARCSVMKEGKKNKKKLDINSKVGSRFVFFSSEYNLVNFC